MQTYLYCLVPAANAADPVPAVPLGMDGTIVRVLRVASVEAWVSTVDRAPAATVRSVREHDGVVSAALATGRTPLPARFGQVWPSDAVCREAVRQRAADLEPLLRRVAGLVEMTVCTLLPGMPARPAVADRDDASPGRAYLQRVRARADRARHLRLALEALRARVSGALGPLARGEVAEIRGSDTALALSVSYLVERDGELRFRRAVDEVAHETAARLVVAGPRAPYSFAPHAWSSGISDAARADLP
jgi:hypothetical protein